jgi:outer membrane protein TolC
MGTGRLVAAGLLVSCTVGPDFEPPKAPSLERYTPGPPPARTASAGVTGGAAQHIGAGGDIPGEWWRLFNSAPLNALIDEALSSSPTVAAAEAALRNAHELTLAGEGAFFPSVQASFNASRNKTAASLSPATASGNLYYSVYSPQLSVSYVPDVFGGTRRQVEALAAQEENQRFQLEAAHLTLTANLVAAAITEASLCGQIAAARGSSTLSANRSTFCTGNNNLVRSRVKTWRRRRLRWRRPRGTFRRCASNSRSSAISSLC